ncbi:MAG: hypothetical protein A3B30_04025 [Candidatus Komeilibacteria bacterium RIFCSPLOWO2_01_FULL_52_15]|uniref:Putative pterin-4-alpha-carbinolamine dehydratase n=2 Tax=Candidatus Komeiliibacteriota TaxID=1817908 RepID=A0A1G2BRZ9_9BACT|nr:MAG: hypothetical protein A2677_00725 [Candidatus Komeilibacteria bacterium RIFCSPHIGHO2_01_FULL_52_14]OGY91329.1 MAG: hypothetical protein A3B30_04025 [Candidatus Komeilibacteria bacterium RIFCSPLOWO2_01_FULL_52_15]
MKKNDQKQPHTPLDLGHKKCVPCEGGVEPFDRKKAENYLRAVPGWELAPDGLSIGKRYTFPNFRTALGFVDAIGALAENEGHHPDLTLGWGRVGIELSTHAVKGLSENDFILAYKIDALPQRS